MKNKAFFMQIKFDWYVRILSVVVALYGSTALAWNDLIQAAQQNDYQRLRALIVDYYYPVLVNRSFNNSEEKHKFSEAIHASGLVDRLNADLPKLINEGVQKDLASLEGIGQTLLAMSKDDVLKQFTFLSNVPDWPDARLRILPDMHTHSDVATAILALLTKI